MLGLADSHFARRYRLIKHQVYGARHPFTLRKSFHIILWFYVALECLSYVPMAFQGEENYTKPFYVLHLLGISCDVTAFSLVTVLWSRTILVDDRRRMNTIFPFVIVVDLAFFGCAPP